MSGLRVSDEVSRYLMGLSDKEAVRGIYRLIARLSEFPIGRWGEEPRTREEICHGHRLIFRLEIDDDGIDCLGLEDIVPLEK